MASTTCRFTAFAPLSDGAMVELMGLATGHREVARGEYIVHEGDAVDGAFLLIDGWTASSIAFANGRRQLIKAHLPGDLLGLPSIALRRAADSVVALTPAVIASVSRDAIGRLFQRSPRLSALMFLISQEERVMLMDRIASIGATDAINRLAALLLQLHGRVVRAHPETGDSFAFPLSQSDVADMTGVTAVHLNRTVQRLRAQGTVTWARQQVTIHDFDALRRLADMPPRVLDHQPDWLPTDGSGE